MKKMIMATLLLFGFSSIMMAQTSTKTKTVKPAPKMTVAKTNTSSHSTASVTPTPKPVTSTATTKTTHPIGKKHKAKKHYRKTAKADAKSNKAATRHVKKPTHGQ